MTGQDLGTENELYRELKESIECVKSLVTEGLARLHVDLDILRNEFKTDFKEMSCTIRDLEKSLNFTQVEVDSFKEQLKKESEERSSEMELLTAKITILEQSLKQAVEQNRTLEQYTRRENLRFNNIKEHRGGSRISKGGGGVDGRPFLLRGGRENALTKKIGNNFTCTCLRRVF